MIKRNHINIDRYENVPVNTQRNQNPMSDQTYIQTRVNWMAKNQRSTHTHTTSEGFLPLFRRVQGVLVHLDVVRCDDVIQRAVVPQTSPLCVYAHLQYASTALRSLASPPIILLRAETNDGLICGLSSKNLYNCTQLVKKTLLPLPPLLRASPFLFLLSFVHSSRCSSTPPCNRHYSQFL